MVLYISVEPQIIMQISSNLTLLEIYVVTPFMKNIPCESKSNIMFYICPIKIKRTILIIFEIKFILLFIKMKNTMRSPKYGNS